MQKNKFNQKSNQIPVEQHETAAWADIEKLKPDSKVSIPSEFNVANAKDWVDENQK